MVQGNMINTFMLTFYDPVYKMASLYLFFFFLMCLCCLQPVEVWTKCGRRGRIREPVGTHGMSIT